MYTFLAKQGQENQICSILISLGLTPRQYHYNGKRGTGVMIEAETGKLSKTKIDRQLHKNKIPGAVSRRNKLQVFNFDKGSDVWSVFEKIGKKPFKRVINGKFQKCHITYEQHCECCGPFHEVHVN